MGIIAYVGLPGSGKSYDVVANQIMPGLEKNLRVVTNIPLHKDAIRDITHRGEMVHLPLEQIAAEPHLIDEYVIPGSLVVLDEVWRLWPSGLKANQVPQPFKSLLAEHRHRVDAEGRATNIVLVTQDLMQLAAFARQLVEYTFYHTKLAHMGARSSYRIDVFHGAQTGAVPPNSNRLRSVFGKYDPKIFKLYQSHTMSESKTSGADEKGLDARANMWRRPSLWLGAVATVGMIVFATSTLGALTSKYGRGDVSEANTPAAVPAERPTPVMFSQQVVRPAQSLSQPIKREAVPQYRLVGTIENHDESGQSVAMITDGTRYAIVDLSSCRPYGGAGGYECDFEGARVNVFGSTY